MRLDFGFGSAVQSVEVPDQNLLEVLTSNEIPGTLTNEEEVTRALRSPIGTPRLGEIVRPGEKVAIITSDVTRPVPTWRSQIGIVLYAEVVHYASSRIISTSV